MSDPQNMSDAQETAELSSEEFALKKALLAKVQQFGAGQEKQLEAEIEEVLRTLIK